MKFSIIFFIIFLNFFKIAYSDEFIALKGLNKIGLQVTEIDRVCNLDHSDVDRNIRYILSNSKINVQSESEIQIYIEPIIIEDSSGLACAGSIIFQVYGIVQATFKRGNPLEGPFSLYERYNVVIHNPTDFADFYLKQIENITKQFISDWSTVNNN